MFYYGPMMRSNDWGFGFLMMILWFAFITSIAIVIFRLVKGHEIGSTKKHDPIDIAKERYAKGELTKKQFEELKKDIAK
ncbi:MAG TPA: SHOCT domain-containing protein [Patescibacteria group bacterium]|nr:SHOCT domain-containing protein [Patescibacteria group bacterium]